MTKKTKNIVTTVVGAILTAVSAIMIAFLPVAKPFVVIITGAINEIVNLVLEAKTEV